MTKDRKDFCDLFNLEEELPDDPTPFMTYVKQKEAIGHLHDLEQANGHTYTPEEELCEEDEEKPPLVGVFSKLEMLATDRKGKIHTIGAMSKGIIREHKLKKIQKNPTLVHLCNINNAKIYYNIPHDQFWIEVYQPMWTNHKRIMKKVASIKLEHHDIETLEAFCLAYRRGFLNPLPKQIWVRKSLKRKIEKICEAFNKRGCEGKTLEKPSRKNHCFGKL